jgi:hypothetical protein
VSGTGEALASVSGEIGGTVRRRADMPLTESTPWHISRARASVMPSRE